MFKSSIAWLVVFSFPLIGYFGYVGWDSLREYDGHCKGLLDSAGQACTRAEFLFDYFLGPFSLTHLALVSICWAFIITAARVAHRGVRS
ncbi:hypothetical protein ACIGHN_27450 [Acidovorax sp. NPDC077693]|uniref:hypothetical protein n=1 Tax=unclassified Acidovorax TaxID=2684926 RepID=UPI0037C79B13